MTETDVLTATEVAGILRCSEKHVAKLVKAKRLPGVNLGGSLGLRIHRDAVDAFVRGQRLPTRATTSTTGRKAAR